MGTHIEYKEKIIQILEGTEAGSIWWSQQNPTTYYITVDQDTILSIQKVSYIDTSELGKFLGSTATAYVFAITVNGEVFLEFDSRKNSDIFGTLEKLYKAAYNSFEKTNINTFDSIVKKLLKK